MSRDGFREHLGLRLRAARVAAGLSQEAVARQIKMSRTSYVNTEQGRQGLDAYRLGQLAHIFGVTADSLLHGPVPERAGLEHKRPPLLTRLWRALS